MELDKNGEVISEAATNDQIKAAIQSLEEDGFVILQEKEQFYVQISGNITSGFDLEYREGDASKHFRGTKDDYTTDEVISVLLKYNQGDDSWKDDVEWEKITF